MQLNCLQICIIEGFTVTPKNESSSEQLSLSSWSNSSISSSLVPTADSTAGPFPGEVTGSYQQKDPRSGVSFFKDFQTVIDGLTVLSENFNERVKTLKVQESVLGFCSSNSFVTEILLMVTLGILILIITVPVVKFHLQGMLVGRNGMFQNGGDGGMKQENFAGNLPRRPRFYIPSSPPESVKGTGQAPSTPVEESKV